MTIHQQLFISYKPNNDNTGGSMSDVEYGDIEDI